MIQTPRRCHGDVHVVLQLLEPVGVLALSFRIRPVPSNSSLLKGLALGSHAPLGSRGLRGRDLASRFVIETPLVLGKGDGCKSFLPALLRSVVLELQAAAQEYNILIEAVSGHN